MNADLKEMSSTDMDNGRIKRISEQSDLQYLKTQFRQFAEDAQRAAKRIKEQNPIVSAQFEAQEDTWHMAANIIEELQSPKEVVDGMGIGFEVPRSARLIQRLLYALAVSSAEMVPPNLIDDSENIT